ncbi:unnamed protein product [Pieris brassicae]|uniref:C2H2-type domain-containing protein n=1 Tax=Pieris brassicae TaxID=7116 RepID=A0A9P0TRR0_PIEBR|nr:unnamed protein product [Pieris brassicae]
MSSYETFYAALVKFRNHYVKQHKQSSLELIESSTEEETEQLDDVEYDDLSKSNMRRDRMDDRTRIELNEVQSKINGKVYYTCKVCEKNLSSAHTYLFHKNIHTGERPCVCHVCGKTFRAPSGLQRHLKETHERVKRYVCALCAKTFVNSQNLRQHMRIHTGERPFVCAQCGKRFTQSGSLHVHLKTHSDLFPFNCTECGAQFRLRSGLSKHRLKHTGERPHVCVNCGKGFRQKHELNSHSLTHSNAKPFACTLCGAAFRQRRALRHHCKRLHESRETASTVVKNEVTPGYCFSFFELEKHTEEKGLLHVNICKNGKSYGTCETCDKKISASCLSRHARSHDEDKTYRCDVCGLGFKESGNLARHERAIHKKLKPFACFVCSNNFSRKSHLEDHIKSHSGNRYCVCDLCGKASKSSNALRMHRRTHFVERNIKCSFCDAKFKRKSELYAHVSVHTGEKAHICECGRASERVSEYLVRIVPAPIYTGFVISSTEAINKRTDTCHVNRQDTFKLLADVSTIYSVQQSETAKVQFMKQQFVHTDTEHANWIHYSKHNTSDKKQPLDYNRFVQTRNNCIDEGSHNRVVSEFPLQTIEDSIEDTNNSTETKTILNSPNSPVSTGAETAYAAYDALPSSTDKVIDRLEQNEFSDHSDTESFARLSESVFEAIEDTRDSIIDKPTDEIRVIEKCKKSKRTRPCPICGKVYTASSSYFYHMKHVHRQSKEHSCDVCGKKFGTRGDLEQHAAVHTAECKYACRSCDKKFRSRASRYIHEQIHEGVKNYECSTCGKCFRWRTHLHRHTLRHAADKKHECAVCGRGFSVHCDLLRHARTHAVGSYECEECRVKFAQIRYLKAHMRKKHSVTSTSDIG